MGSSNSPSRFDPLFSSSEWSKFEIFPETDYRFFGTSKQLGDILINFVPGSDAEITHMTIDFAFSSWPFEKR
jgi:hypothetical protein